MLSDGTVQDLITLPYLLFYVILPHNPRVHTVIEYVTDKHRVSYEEKNLFNVQMFFVLHLLSTKYTTEYCSSGRKVAAVILIH